MRHCLKLLSVLSLSVSLSTFAGSLSLTSTDITHGELMTKSQVFNGFGCSGDDVSPQLQWSGAPKGTKSFAITAYDPDAPTGSGWWHWQLVNIPKGISTLDTGAGSTNKDDAPKGSSHVGNDFGTKGFGGACPPKGHGVHHYRFTVHALSVEKLDLPQGASGALAGYMINANTIETSTIESLYKRD
jgi:Raf kinase inhibitor-like YbhB/YbcL family protein